MGNSSLYWWRNVGIILKSSQSSYADYGVKRKFIPNYLLTYIYMFSTSIHTSQAQNEAVQSVGWFALSLSSSSLVLPFEAVAELLFTFNFTSFTLDTRFVPATWANQRSTFFCSCKLFNYKREKWLRALSHSLRRMQIFHLIFESTFGHSLKSLNLLTSFFLRLPIAKISQFFSPPRTFDAFQRAN